MVDGVLISPSAKRTLLSIQNVQSVIDRTSLNLSTSKDVNSAFDNPGNFFTSQALSNRSADLIRTLDGIERSISVVKEALVGVEALTQLLAQGQAIAIESQRLLDAGIVDPEIFEFELDTTLAPLSDQILSDNPVGYWQLNDAAGVVAVNQGSGGAAINGTYQSGVTLNAPGLYPNGAANSADFDGVNDRILIPDSALINTAPRAQRTVELVFNADNAGGARQVLWEEGGNTNALNIYIQGGLIYFNIRDAGDFGPFTITAPIVSGTTYHAAVVFDSTGSGTFTGYLDGVPVGSGVVTSDFDAHTGNIGIGSLQDQSFMHDGPSPSNTFRFNGRISDVALYNTALSAGAIERHADSLDFTTEIEYRHRQFEQVLDQINFLVKDASFQGSNLLTGGSIETFFNERRTSSIVTEGVDFSALGLEIERNDFNNADDLEDVIESVGLALAQVRNFGVALANDVLIMETRLKFTREFSNTLQEGADALVLADMNAESAKLLAAQTRLDLGITALNVINLFQASILTVFSA